MKTNASKMRSKNETRKKGGTIYVAIDVFDLFSCET